MLTKFLKYYSVKKKMEYSGDLYNDLIDQLGGQLFNDGLFVVFERNDIVKWNGIVSEAYPTFQASSQVFAHDWLGRVFGIDLREETYGNILMYELGTADILEIPCNIENFLNTELTKYADDSLAQRYFKKWQKKSHQKLQYGQCVGYKVPLFLNGSDSIDNLELSDMEVYWGIVSQLMRL